MAIETNDGYTVTGGPAQPIYITNAALPAMSGIDEAGQAARLGLVNNGDDTFAVQPLKPKGIVIAPRAVYTEPVAVTINNAGYRGLMVMTRRYDEAPAIAVGVYVSTPFLADAAETILLGLDWGGAGSVFQTGLIYVYPGADAGTFTTPPVVGATNYVPFNFCLPDVFTVSASGEDDTPVEFAVYAVLLP